MMQRRDALSAWHLCKRQVGMLVFDTAATVSSIGSAAGYYIKTHSLDAAPLAGLVAALGIGFGIAEFATLRRNLRNVPVQPPSGDRPAFRGARSLETHPDAQRRQAKAGKLPGRNL